MPTKKTPKLYGMDKITTEKVMDNLGYVSIYIWKIRRIWLVAFRKKSADVGMQFTPTYFK